MPSFSKVILFRYHPDPALPHPGGGLFFLERIRSPEESVATRVAARTGSAPKGAVYVGVIRRVDGHLPGADNAELSSTLL